MTAEILFIERIKLSGRRGSNPRRPAWEADILPLNYSRLYSKINKMELIVYVNSNAIEIMIEEFLI